MTRTSFLSQSHYVIAEKRDSEDAASRLNYSEFNTSVSIVLVDVSVCCAREGQQAVGNEIYV